MIYFILIVSLFLNLYFYSVLNKPSKAYQYKIIEIVEFLKYVFFISDPVDKILQASNNSKVYSFRLITNTKKCFSILGLLFGYKKYNLTILKYKYSGYDKYEQIKVYIKQPEYLFEEKIKIIYKSLYNNENNNIIIVEKQ